jgi:phage baseplate assembly protein V
MFRVGIVQEQDVVNAKVRVVFPDYDQMLSWWLFIAVPKTQNDKAYWIPDIGEQVLCFMDEHDEDGAVLGAIYSQVDTTPVQSADKWHITMQDGAVFEYDRSSSQFLMSLPLGGSVTITANQVTIQIDASGNVNVTAKQDANLTATHGSVSLTANQGNINLSTNGVDTSINDIVTTYNEHTHPLPQGGDTLPPNQLIGEII